MPQEPNEDLAISTKRHSVFITDHLGTPTKLIDEDGNLLWSAQPDDWAAVQNERMIPNLSQPIRFQGQWLDEETGLYYNRYRYYDSKQGRYITQDPIGLAGGLNSYSYVANPTGWIDALGLSPSCLTVRPDIDGNLVCQDGLTPEQICAAQGNQMVLNKDNICQIRDSAGFKAGRLTESTSTHDDTKTGINLCAAIGTLAGKGEVPFEIDVADKVATGFNKAHKYIHGVDFPHIEKYQYVASFSTRFQNLQEYCKATAGKQNWQLKKWN